MNDPDTTEKVERTDVGYRLTVESTRGTGPRDQDKIKMEARTETYPEPATMNDMVNDIGQLMKKRRMHQPDEDPDNE